MNAIQKLNYWLLFSCACLAFLPQALADEAKGGYQRPQLEKQVKFMVPASVADSLWRYIQHRYQATALKKVDPHYASEITEETHVDTYFDNAAFTLLRQQHSLRLRRIFTGKDVSHALIQLKISEGSPQPATRQEIKFNLNNRPDKHATDPGHPFLMLVRSADRPLLDSLLQKLEVKSQELRPALTLHQKRQRLNLLDRGNALAYLSLDRVSREDGEAGFYELELALNEAAFTGASTAQRQKLSNLAAWLQLDLTRRFPGLRQDQSPKYNKMYKLLHESKPRPLLFNLGWLVIGLIIGAICLYLFFTRNRQAPALQGLI